MLELTKMEHQEQNILSVERLYSEYQVFEITIPHEKYAQQQIQGPITLRNLLPTIPNKSSLQKRI